MHAHIPQNRTWVDGCHAVPAVQKQTFVFAATPGILCGSNSVKIVFCPHPSRQIEVSVWKSLQSQETSVESGTGVYEKSQCRKPDKIQTPAPPDFKVG